MKLTDLQIENFGAESSLGLQGISPQLNVVFSPNGAGKTTVIHFVRWMMFGDRDEISRRYLNHHGTPSSGTMTVSDRFGHRTLRRTSQSGSLLSKISLDGDLSSAETSPVASPIGVSNAEFDRFFTVSFDRPRSVSDLLNTARAHRLHVDADRQQENRISHLRHQLAERKAELLRLLPGGEFESLRSRRTELLGKIESLQSDWCERREYLQDMREECESAAETQQAVVDRLRTVAANVELAIENRRALLDQEHDQWLNRRDEFDRSREQRVNDIDGQISRWQDIMDDVRQRLDDTRSQISTISEAEVPYSEMTDSRLYLQRLGFRIHDVEQDLDRVRHSDSLSDQHAEVHYLKGLLGSAFDSVQTDVNRLAKTMEKQSQVHELREHQEELSYLARVHRELSELLQALHRQRQNFLPPSDLEPSFVAASELDDFRLRHLVERRDAATARIGRAELELSVLLRNKRDSEQACLQHERHRVATHDLHREIEQIDARLSQLNQRATLEHSVAQIEEELAELLQVPDRSEILNEASAILGRLTASEFHQVFVDDQHACRVRRADGEDVAYSQLGRNLQDLVFLSVNFSIVSQYQRRGVSAPLLLNDVFANLDRASAIRLTDFIDSFTNGEIQTIVFTRQQHIVELFSLQKARHFTLRDSVASPVEPISYHVAPKPYFPPAVHETPRKPTYQWVAEWQNGIPESHARSTKTTRLHMTPDQGESALRLAPNDAVFDSPVVNDDFSRHLRRIRLLTIGEFLEADPNSIADSLAPHGITQEMVQRRQRETLLLMHLDISVTDAQLLVACGVPDPARLGRADAAVLLKRVETILARPQAEAKFGSFADYTLDRVEAWIEMAQECDYRSRSRRRQNARPTKLDISDRSQRQNKEAESIQTTVKLNADTAHRFYLEVNDPVVDAPDIGPRTAERLNELDIYTIANLLDTAAEDIAAQLDEKRISADTIVQWQIQSQLVCRIPNLRGNDAKILVACGVEDPITLSAMDPKSLHKQVTSYLSSKDGKRAVRGGKKPTKNDVQDWIAWADSARTLKAA